MTIARLRFTGLFAVAEQMAILQTIRSFFVPIGFDEAEVIIPASPTVYSIRPLTSKHLAEVMRLNFRCFKNGENYTKHTFAYLLNDPRTLSYRIITARGEMAGFVFAILNPDGAAHITTIGVAPEHRRRRLGERMLEYLDDALCAKGISTVVLEVRVGNTAAQNLYRLAGFSVVQRVPGYYNNGEDGYLMLKSLV